MIEEEDALNEWLRPNQHIYHVDKYRTAAYPKMDYAAVSSPYKILRHCGLRAAIPWIERIIKGLRLGGRNDDVSLTCNDCFVFKCSNSQTIVEKTVSIWYAWRGSG